MFTMAQHAVLHISPRTRKHAVRGAGPRVADDTRAKLIEAAGQVLPNAATRRDDSGNLPPRGRECRGGELHLRRQDGAVHGSAAASVRASKTAALTAALDTSRSPEETIRGVIRARLMSLCSEERPDWQFRLVMHEFSHPTPAMGRVVDEGMRPIYDRMRKAVGEIIGLPPDHETTRLSVNSIIGQILVLHIFPAGAGAIAAGVETHAGTVGTHRGPHRGFFARVFEKSGARKTTMDEMKTSTMTSSAAVTRSREHSSASVNRRSASRTKASHEASRPACADRDHRRGDRVAALVSLENFFRRAKLAREHHRAQRAH